MKLAKNGEYTLSVNNINIYSMYNPRKDAEKFIIQAYNKDAEGYVLIGLGLGYHLEHLVKLCEKKKIIVLPIDKQELEVFNNFSSRKHSIVTDNVELISEGNLSDQFLNFQMLIPFAVMKAIGYDHHLYPYLEDIKIRQMSNNKFCSLMKENFKSNIDNKDLSINFLYEQYKGKLAFLISAGPSLESTVNILGEIQEKAFVLCVGSALNVLLENNIVPDAVIVTDPSPLVMKQILEVDYDGMLFYLATANHEMTLNHVGERFIIFQEGFSLSEDFAKTHGIPLLETGGSVATTAFSLLEYMGFEKICFFGQDLGFIGTNTHAMNSTSNVKFQETTNFRKVIANSGEYINTRADLNSFKRWFEKKASKTSIKLYNTALSGAKIKGIPYISENEILHILCK
ncbi:6-hydroxymethylpterin diphosphokinase MptE-like protein [Psychrobacillus sp. FSL K6-2684]|uniref:motility associated factor glycosyltransferase family protein n=1 Tax=Psychrobacillus sp. FSL K6-2684 TaxID=2921547 RepID=UPI0030F58C6F